jgi:hypothetical protein
MIKLLPLPALLVPALLSAGLPATPALAGPGTVPATYNGAPVQLRAEYVPASQFAAPAAASVSGPTAAPGQHAPDFPPEGYGQDGPAPAAWQPQADAEQAYAQPADGARNIPAQYAGGYPQTGYPQAGYTPAGYGQVAYPPPVTVVYARQVVPVAYPVPVGWRGHGFRGRGYGWNRGWGGGVVIQPGWNGGFYRGGHGGYGRGYGRGHYGGYGGGWGCRSTGAGALAGSVAGAAIGYGLANRWDRGTGVVLGGIVGALAGTAIERSGRC